LSEELSEEFSGRAACKSRLPKSVGPERVCQVSRPESVGPHQSVRDRSVRHRTVQQGTVSYGTMQHEAVPQGRAGNSASISLAGSSVRFVRQSSWAFPFGSFSTRDNTSNRMGNRTGDRTAPEWNSTDTWTRCPRQNDTTDRSRGLRRRCSEDSWTGDTV